MANSKKRRKIFVFTAIGLGLAVLLFMAVFKKREPVISIQTEKVVRTNLTETVVANGKIQPVVQVHISPEVSGEIITLAVKEGQHVNRGDLLLKIKPDFYIAGLNQSEAGYESALAGEATEKANLEKADAEFTRNAELFRRNLISESDYVGFKTARDVAVAQLDAARHQVDSAKALVFSAQDSLDKTTIVSPITGTVSKLNSQLGERVLGTVQNAGTDIMIIADLNEMEARVDVGEMDVVLIQPGQNVRLEVDSFKDRKFTGTVTDVADSSEGLDTAAAAASSSSSSGQEATKFEVRIRVKEKEMFRPGMSVTGEIETRSRTNVLAVPFPSVTARPPRAQPRDKGASTNMVASTIAHTNVVPSDGLKQAARMVDVVFRVEGDHVKMVPVTTGISDETHWEIVDGLKEGDEIVSGGFRAISRDLEDGKRVKKGPGAGAAKDQP